MKVLRRSFAGGEVTPEMHGRIDLTKFQTGLGLASNFLILPHGPAARRPGFGYIQQCWSSNTPVRLIPFAYSADQAVVIEFGHRYARFHTKDGSVLEDQKFITAIAGDVVTIPSHGYGVADWLFIGGGFFQVKTVNNANQFTLQGIRGEVAAPVGAAASRVYTIETPYEASDLFQITYSQDSDVLTLCHRSYAARELRRLGATNWQLATISFEPSIAWPASVSSTLFKPTAGQDTAYEYVVTAVAADGVTESYRSGSTVIANALNLSGNYNDISWSAVAGASRYYVYKKRGGVWGYIGQTTDLTLRDDNILPDTTRTPPESIITLNGANDYPAAVAHFEQRRWFGGTFNKPQNIWATRSATQSNLTSSVPGRDDDAMEFRIAARQNNAIRHLLPLSDIIALTAGGEWRIYSDGTAITFSTLVVKPQGYAGASHVQPVVTSGSILYVQAQGYRLRELSYNWEVNSYRTIDLSIMAPHLFNGYTINELAYSRAPDQILWAVRSDGKLLSMTYVPDQQVYAWARHQTYEGTFESCCVIPEGADDALYVVVRRYVRGQWWRYIERLRTRVFSDPNDAFFVDSGLTYKGLSVSTISNLWHLEGKPVSILADGAVERDQIVTNGSVQLQVPASTVSVGLPIVSDMATLPLATEALQAGGQGTMKNVNAVSFRIHQSSLLKAGPSFNSLTEYPGRSVTDNYDSPPALTSSEVRMTITPTWTHDGIVCIRQDQPLPLTVASMTLEVVSGG